MAESVYTYNDYKKFIKERIKFLKQRKPKLSLHYLSDKLGIQYTFLSKVLNSETHHLNEDHLFIVGEVLELPHDQTDFLFLLRSFQSTQSQTRKNFLDQKISSIQKNNHLGKDIVELNSANLVDELAYLMEYFATVTHAALGINEIKTDPMRLTSLLKLDSAKLKSIFNLLDRLNLIEYSAKENKINKINNLKLYYGKDHPLTRTHQVVMKSHLTQSSFIKPENEKENFFVTFTTDKEGFEKIKKELLNCAKEIQKIVLSHKHHGVYQLNIDFVEIFNLKP